jgi:hypothetical protein
VRDPAFGTLHAFEGDPERFFAIMEQFPAVIGVFRGPDLVVEFANPLYRRMTGDRPMVGIPVGELFDQPENQPFVEQLHRVLESGETFHGDGWRGVIAGEEVFYDFTYVPLRDPGDEVDGILVFAVDVTRRVSAHRKHELVLAREREARREAELAAGRMARLQRITAALSAAISADEVAHLVVEQAVEALGAAAGVVVLRDGRELELRHHVGYDLAVTEPWSRFDLDTPVPIAEAVRNGEIVTIESREAWEARYPDSPITVRQFEAVAAVPFEFQGVALGAMGVSFERPHAFSPEDRAFMIALGRQCGQALERARLYEERAYVARTLQDGLLPEALAVPPGADVAVRYHSISDGGEVGGDFYDLFDVSEDRWLLAIGDVCGKGTAAAVLTGLARHTIRAIAMREEAPQDVLAFLNEAMRRQVVDGSYCTVGCATLTPLEHGGFAACLASGGHPNPLLIRSGEAVREIEVPGTLLGFVPGLALDAVSFELRPGDVLVYYTDGITDARGDGERFGDERLWATLEQARHGDAEAIADAVDGAVRAHQPDRPKDDRAVMVLKVLGDGSDGA